MVQCLKDMKLCQKGIRVNEFHAKTENIKAQDSSQERLMRHWFLFLSVYILEVFIFKIEMKICH